MRGLYSEAVPAFEEALAAEAEWEDAKANLALCRTLAARTQRKGGEQLSKIGADEISFDKRDPDSGAEDEQPAEQQMSESQLRAMWLRNVQTRPADFLRAKFSYQAAMQEQREAKP